MYFPKNALNVGYLPLFDIIHLINALFLFFLIEVKLPEILGYKFPKEIYALKEKKFKELHNLLGKTKWNGSCYSAK